MCQMAVSEFDLITTLKFYIHLFRFYSFLLVEYGHLLKINGGNTVYASFRARREKLMCVQDVIIT